ncbi:MAG: hypothetical protein NC924_06105 [Candidatus Omnitrophica bacterium]|nr:hypothetical protein [Candidatus Omnitrophota bacterium]
MGKQPIQERAVRYLLSENGGFVIENYDRAKPFAGFFPGIAGLYGIPLWVFYVNRGQGIVSCGTKDKDGAIMEFYAANRAWQMASLQGFRTFLKIKGKKTVYYEPFQNSLQSERLRLQRSMRIDSAGFSLEEINQSLGLIFRVEYNTLAEEPLAGLFRKLTIINRSRQAKVIEVLDGLPSVIPYGHNHWLLKFLSRTIEAWVRVYFVTPRQAPFFKLDVDPADRPQVEPIEGGNFFYSYGAHAARVSDARFIVDPQAIFGHVSDFNYPHCFFSDAFAFPRRQATANQTPAAFGLHQWELPAGESAAVFTVVGQTAQEPLLAEFLNKFYAPEYLEEQCRRQRQLLGAIQDNLFTASGMPVFDAYCRQTYLDNILRGGLPHSLSAGPQRMIFHVYSRKHGDLERDYNNFLLEPTYFSQGNGNYRDVNQNRRHDCWFVPEAAEDNLVRFYNLVQLDGYNPLVVMGARFFLREPEQAGQLCAGAVAKDAAHKLVHFLQQPFTPGSLFRFLEKNAVALRVPAGEFLSRVLAVCEKRDMAEHGEGFWVDHWTYNWDSVEAFAAMFPERLREVIFEKKELFYFQNFAWVKPRREKYVLSGGRVRQYHAVGEEKNAAARNQAGDWMARAEYGRGAPYTTTIAGKLICLLANKAATFDPFGCGIEMEADKPGWYDALNGLPGLCGSSTCETMELLRLIRGVKDLLVTVGLPADAVVAVPEELAHFFQETIGLAAAYLHGDVATRDLLYWERAGQAKEAYRERIRGGVSGREQMLTLPVLDKALDVLERKCVIAFQKIKDESSGLYHTYYINEIVEYERLIAADGSPQLSKDGLALVVPKKFRQIPLPLFLEAQVHALRVDSAAAARIHAAVCRSPLYDPALKMFKVNASLHALSEEIGRARNFLPGWLENESIWLHMEYKYILELLRNSLFREFFDAMRDVLVAFQPADRYGRSILENSSFIVSSAYPDEKLHGNGFVARLSGSTAEFLQVWLWMNIGKVPFRVGPDGQLSLHFSPVLPAWLFNQRKRKVVWGTDAHGLPRTLTLGSGEYAFNLFGKTLVVYKNAGLRDTFGEAGVRPISLQVRYRDGGVRNVAGDTLYGSDATRVRGGDAERVTIVLD